jgi:hypothetical protein
MQITTPKRAAGTLYTLRSREQTEQATLLLLEGTQDGGCHRRKTDYKNNSTVNTPMRPAD